MSVRKVQQESFWPGYVDAIINVVLNILFMVALFTVALSTIDFRAPTTVKAEEEARTPVGQVPVKQPDEPLASLPQQIAISALPFKSQTGTQADAGTATGNDREVAVKWDTRKLQEGAQLITVSFDDRLADIPPAQNSAFSSLLRDLGSSVPKGQWLIWISSDTRQASASRLAYMRIVSVRSALVEAGISPEVIQTRIIDIRENADTPANRVQIALHSS